MDCAGSVEDGSTRLRRYQYFLIIRSASPRQRREHHEGLCAASGAAPAQGETFLRGRSERAQRLPLLPRYGSRMRPGAPLAPAAVWQVLQSPTVCDAVIARSLPPLRIFAVYGVESADIDSL